MSRFAALLSISAVAAFGVNPAPSINAVTNAFSFGNQLCPGLLATVYGANFGSSPANTTVLVGGTSAHVDSEGYSASQFNIQIPFSTGLGPAAIVVTVSGASSTAFNATISAVSPYFQSMDGSGTGPIAAVETASGAAVTPQAPAHGGDELTVYAAGLGATNPATQDIADGVAAATAQVSPRPTITVGDTPATVTFAGVVQATYSALYQVNFTVPAGLSGIQPVVMTAGGVTSTSVGVNQPVQTLAIASGAAAPTVTAVQNETYGASLCPGILAIVYGTGFGVDATRVTFSVGGKAGYIFPQEVTSNQLLVQIPFEAATGATSMIVTVDGTPSAAFNITLATTAPAWLVQASAAAGPADVFETGNNAQVALTAPAGSPANTTVVAAKPGDTLYGYAIGLGPTNPPSATGVQTASTPAAVTPSVTVGGIAATNVVASLTSSFVGIYQVNFTVPPGVQGTVPLVVSSGGNGSPATVATLAVAGLSAVTNNASFVNPGTASPGSIVSVFANGLGTTSNETSGVFPQSQSEGVQVTFTGGPAHAEGGPIFHVIGSAAPQQVDLLVPADLPTSGTVNVQLSTATTKYPNYTLNMVPANPGLYRINDPQKTERSNVIAQFNGTVWLALPASTTTALGLPACDTTTGALTPCGQPAQAGDVLAIYLTGLGLATPNGDPKGTPLATGQVAPVGGSPLYETTATPSVIIGGVPATTVYFSGLAPGFAGLYQINVQVPPGITNGDDVPVQVTLAGMSDTATISIQSRQ